MQVCKNPKCNEKFKTKVSNPTQKYHSRECCNAHRRELTKRLKKLQARYKKIDERERRAIGHINRMGLENPTDTQIKDICGSFMANWRIVKENLELQELCNNAEYFKY